MDPVITSRSNARVKALRAALEAKRRDSDLVAIEGPNLIAEALRSGLELHSIFVREDRTHLLENTSLPGSTQINVLASDVFTSASATEQAQGIAALVEQPRHVLQAHGDSIVLVLANLQDPGNMGTLIRSAEAFGASAVVVTPGTVDPWNQKSLRASAGSVFRMPIVYSDIASLKAQGFLLIAAVARDGIEPEQLPRARRRAILIGNEGNGLTADQLSQADTFTTIPCPGHVESLNAAIAGSILLYAISRQTIQQ